MTLHTDPKSISNLYQPLDEVAASFSRIAFDIVSSKWFNREEFRQWDLLLSEAYVLLWQNAETGHVDGRKFGLPLKVGAYACVFIDLVVAEKIEIFPATEDNDARVKVINDEPTGTFLDRVLFDDLRSRGQRPINLPKWLERAEESDCVDGILENLILRGILSKKKSSVLGIKLFKKFPTANPEPEKAIEKQIRVVAAKECEPDAYLVALLGLCREGDSIFMTDDPILRKHFSALEYPEAKKNIDHILTRRLKKSKRGSFRRRSTNYDSQ